MIHKNQLKRMAAITFAAVMPLLAGGFYLEVGNPSANSDPKAKDALFVVRATGCHQPEKASFTATAEGKVNGKRESVPLKLVPLSQTGSYAIRRDFPAEGRWVVTVAGVSTTGAVTSVAVPIKEIGFDRASIKFVQGKLVREDVEEMIR
jgi:hypothetical protein